jgi:hypothetical protein
MGPTPAQRPRSVVTTSRSSPMGEHHADNLPRRHPRGTCAHMLLPCSPGQPTDTLALDQLPWSARRRSAAPQPVRVRSGGPDLLSTLVPATHCQRWTIPSPPGPLRAATTRPLGTTATRRTSAPTVACPGHRRSGSSAVRTARTQRPRTPDACLSGHPDHAGRVDTGRLDTGPPPDQLDGRPHGGQRTRTGRRTVWPASGHPRRRRPPAGWRNPRSGCSVCGARRPMTAPR